MASDGWVKLWRETLDSALWRRLNAGQWRVWQVLLMRANWRTSTVVEYDGTRVTVQPGDLIDSDAIIAKLARVSESMVTRSQLVFESMGTTKRTRHRGFRVVSIVNWELYQSPEDRTATGSATPSATGSATPSATHQKKGRREEGKKEDTTLSASADARALPAMWNSILPPAFPRWRETSGARARLVKLRLKDRGLEGDNGWRAVLSKLAASPFASGGGSTGWRASPDWLLRPDTASRILEGKYDGGTAWQSCRNRAPRYDPNQGIIGAPDFRRPTTRAVPTASPPTSAANPSAVPAAARASPDSATPTSARPAAIGFRPNTGATEAPDDDIPF